MTKSIPTRISPDLLDTIGRSFKFRHGKGVAEWLKNSLDAYLRSHAAGDEDRSGAWPAVLWLMNGAKGRPGPNLAVIDFCGTSFAQLDRFFLHWGDTSAATHGGRVKAQTVTGGHGNGGKFYMREMWKDGARLLTWKAGRLSSLVVNKAQSGYTGYWEYEDAQMPDWRNALRAAFPKKEGLLPPIGILRHLEHADPELIAQLDKEVRGLTVVVGRRAKQLWSSNDVVSGAKWRHQHLIDDILSAPQARRPVRELRLQVVVDQGKPSVLTRIDPPDDPDWPPVTVDVPGTLIGVGQGSIGQLTIRKSSERLVGRLRDRHGVLVMDDRRNPIAQYPMTELAVPPRPAASFLHGELSLAFPTLNELIQNDRERLIPGDRTAALLTEVAAAIVSQLEAIENAERQRENTARLATAIPLNDSLNQHARKFLLKLETEVFSDFVETDDGGGPGPAGTGTARTGERSGVTDQGNTDDTEPNDSGGSGGGEGSGGTHSTGGGTHKTRRPKFPQVLISGIDADPASPTSDTKELSKMDPPLYQDDEDQRFNAWWINASHPFAVAAMEQGGAKGHMFRSHQLFMFRDVVQREAMRMLQRREAEMALDRLETELDEVSNKFLGELPVDVLELFTGNKSV